MVGICAVPRILTTFATGGVGRVVGNRFDRGNRHSLAGRHRWRGGAGFRGLCDGKTYAGHGRGPTFEAVPDPWFCLRAMMDSDETYEVPFEIETSDDQYEDVPDQDADDGSHVDQIGSVDRSGDDGDPVGDDAGEVDPEVAAARQAFDDDDPDAEMDDEAAVAVAGPFVQSWNQLISTTNWEKGRIIALWRAALIENDAPAVAHSDAAWVRRVGGVTAPHVGRLRRVYERFADTYQTYDGLFWTHFLAALDWDDASMWLEGAVRENWSISKMRDARWRAMGAVDSNRPTASKIVDVDLDEDVAMPAGEDRRGGEDEDGGRRDFDGDGPGASGPQYDDPDFGDADELVSLAGSEQDNSPSGVVADEQSKVVQPFRDLPELPDDLSDAIETLKLSILRHKSDGWRDVDAETLQKYLRAVEMLLG